MSRYNFIHNFINTPGVYKIIQFLMSGTLIEKKIINTRISNKKLKVLDIGCGPANVFKLFTKMRLLWIRYRQRSINYAKKNIIRKIFIFLQKI